MPKAQRMPFINEEKLEKDHIKLLEWLQDWEQSTPETEYRTTSKEDYQFYAGQQDTDEVVEILQDQKRPVSVFNEIKPKIDMLIGLAAQTRFQPDVVPVGVEDEALAELVQGTLYHYAKKLKLVRREVECFEHVAKAGRSLLYFYIDKENPFKPKIKAKRIPGSNFVVDPESIEYDMSDARALFLDRWVTEEDLKAYWPNVDVSMIRDHVGEGYPKFFNEQEDLYRLVEAWYWKYIEVIWFINPLTGKEEYLPPKDFSKFSAALMEGLPGPDGQRGEPIQPPEGQRSVMKQMYYMLFTDVFKLEGRQSPYRWKGFPAILFGGYKNDDANAWFGAITMMKDPQVALNTMRRQLSHLLQTLPKGILKHEVGAVLNIEEYEKRSADPSFHLEVAKGMYDKVGFEKQPPISPVYQTYDAVMSQSMKDTSGIQSDLMGHQMTSREPGVTVQRRQEANLAVLYILFDNFRESRLEAARLLLSLIQQYVTQAELVRIQGENSVKLMQINSQMNPESAGFNDISVGEYDLEVEETVENSTVRMAIASMLTEFNHNNPNSIPPDLILEYANVPLSVKMRVRENWERMMQAQEEQADADRALKIVELSMKTGVEKQKIAASVEAARKQAAKPKTKREN